MLTTMGTVIDGSKHLVRRAGPVLCIALTLGACRADEHGPVAVPSYSATLGNEQVTSRIGASANLRAVSLGRLERGFEDAQLRLELTTPEFGGMAAVGDTVVVFARPGRTVDELRAAIGSQATILGFPRDLTTKLAAGAVTVRPAAYTFSQLVDWKDRLGVRLLLRVPNVVGVDADESKNRVRVELTDAASRAIVLDSAGALGVPAEAIVFDLVKAEVVDVNLRAKHRPTGGGVQIVNAGGEFTECTLGFNARISSDATGGFLTASHCAYGTRGAGTTGGSMYQHSLSASNKVGVVTNNPPWNQTQGGCTVDGITYPNCTAADVMFVSYDAGIWQPLQMTKVAMTSSVGTNNAAGSYSVSNWWTNVFQPTQNPYSGATVDKVGRTTGWTRGTLSQLCVNKVHSYGATSPFNGQTINVVVLCAHRVDGAGVGGGDSGSPVFPPAGSPPGALYPWGILHAGYNQVNGICSSNCTYYFSGFSMIHGHLQQTYIYYN